MQYRIMPLRKVNLATTSLVDNVVSFVNVTAKRLHIMKVIGTGQATAAVVIGDIAESDLDEVPVGQGDVNDSRSHVARMALEATGGTGNINMNGTRAALSFNRNDLVIDPDEALFVNNRDRVGAPAVLFTWNIWYDD